MSSSAAPVPARIGPSEVLEVNPRFVLDTTRAGLTPLQAARETDLGRFGELLDVERIVGDLHRASADLDGRPLGKPLDVMAAFAALVAHHGASR
jgi:cyclase